MPKSISSTRLGPIEANQTAAKTGNLNKYEAKAPAFRLNVSPKPLESPTIVNRFFNYVDFKKQEYKQLRVIEKLKDGIEKLEYELEELPYQLNAARQIHNEEDKSPSNCSDYLDAQDDIIKYTKKQQENPKKISEMRQQVCQENKTLQHYRLNYWHPKLLQTDT